MKPAVHIVLLAFYVATIEIIAIFSMADLFRLPRLDSGPVAQVVGFNWGEGSEAALPIRNKAVE